MLALLRRQISDERVIGAMAAVPREHFVPSALRPYAYADAPLPIGEGQTISQPLVVAMMLEALQLKPSDAVLEVGTGSGYVAALLSRLAAEVTTVERKPLLLADALARIHDLQITNVHCEEAAGVLGWPDRAPYDAILVSAGAPHVPRVLIEQLVAGGRLVLPVGPLRNQQLVRVRTQRNGALQLERLGNCAFVPLVGDDAWPAGA
jgi:protein-L-isoaspartate(D-aspartate) O-methyltransferase